MKKAFTLILFFALFVISVSAQCYLSNYNKGKVQFDAGQYSAAKATLQVAIGCDDAGSGSEARNLIAQCDAKMAAQCKQIEMDKGIALYNQKDFNNAKLAFNKAMSCSNSDDDSDVRSYMILCDDGVAEIQKSNYMNEGNSLFNVGKYQDAIVAYSKSKSVSSSDDDAIAISMINKCNKTVSWSATFGGTKDDVVNDIEQCQDGGIIIAGYTKSKSEKARSWIIKVNGLGELEWEKADESTRDTEASSIIQLSDGSIIIVGTVGFIGKTYCYVEKLSSTGTSVWKKSFESLNANEGLSIAKSNNGEFAIAGRLSQKGSDFWVVKFNSSGETLWQKAFGGSFYDEATSIVALKEGGYIVAGYKSNNEYTDRDFYLAALDESGLVVWEKVYSYGYDDRAKSVTQSDDNGFVVVGSTLPSSGENSKWWILKTNADGEILWQKNFGGGYGDAAMSVNKTVDGGFVVAGCTRSKGAGYSDYYIVKLTKSGILEWDYTFGSEQNDEAFSVSQTADNGYVVAGNVWNSSSASWNAWILKLDKNGNLRSK